MIHQLNIYGKDKVQVSVERLQTFEPPEGYYLAFSGGKDSVVIKALADMAGVKYDAHYIHTSVEPPEVIRFTRQHHPDVAIDFPRDKDGNRITMWNLIPKKSYPPTRIVRYCCAALKEQQSAGRMTITGVRWAESPNRKRNQGEITVMSPKKRLKDELINGGNFSQTPRGGVVLNNDNEESRKMVEQCYKLAATVVNPIIDWSNEDVWEFIREYNIPYCELYDAGSSRLGCIGCPMASYEKRVKQFEKYPKFRDMYVRAFDRMLQDGARRGIGYKRWSTGEDVYNWWISEGST